MPHILVEISDNIVEEFEPKELLRELNQTLDSVESFRIADIKGRLVRHSDYVVAGNEKDQAFVHLHLSALAGRSKEVKTEAGAKLLECIQKRFSKSAQEKDCAFSIEIRDMDKEFYLKS